MGIFSDFVDSWNKAKYGEPKLTSHLDEYVIRKIDNGMLPNVDVRKYLFLAPGEKCHYADDAYKYNGKKGFMDYDYSVGTLFITNKRIILEAPGGFVVSIVMNEQYGLVIVVDLFHSVNPN